VTYAADATASATVREVVAQSSSMVLMFLMMLAFRGTARRSGLPRATARFWSTTFWSTTAWAMCAYGVGMAFDLATLLSPLDLGGQTGRLGTDVMFPVAGLLTIVAMYQYPTTARTRGERITVGLDAGIVLLGSAVFLWYFSVSRGWTPEAGPIALLQALLQPVLALVAGFAVLKIAYVGAGVISRRTLQAFGASIAITVVCGSVPASNSALSELAVELEMLSPLVALVGAVYQYTSSSQSTKGTQDDRSRRRPGRRRAFSILPFGASGAAFLLLVVVLEPTLSWRKWGVLCGIGLLLCSVSARQFLALRENGRLLARNDRLTAELRQQAWFDELTGLANRAQYGERIREALALCRRQKTRVALLLIDLDDFKAVNDTLGHAAGDALLQEVAGRLTAHTRIGDTVCRIGGDEFVVIAEDIDETAAGQLAAGLIRAVTEPVRIAQHSVQVGASVGISLADGADLDAGEILRTADVALYEVKADGKGGWRMPTPAARPTAALAPTG
jgi:diguanylate cyclase (GGDEF)-like protein